MNIIDLIEKNKTPNGGWTKQFLQSIGIDEFPPPKGWLKRFKAQHENKELQLTEALVNEDFNSGDHFVYAFPDDYNNNLELRQNHISRYYGSIRGYELLRDDGLISVTVNFSKLMTRDEKELVIREYSNNLCNYGKSEIFFALRVYGTRFWFKCKWDSVTRQDNQGDLSLIIYFKVDYENEPVMIANSGVEAKLTIHELLQKSIECWENTVVEV